MIVTGYATIVIMIHVMDFRIPGIIILPIEKKNTYKYLRNYGVSIGF